MILLGRVRLKVSVDSERRFVVQCKCLKLMLKNGEFSYCHGTTKLVKQDAYTRFVVVQVWQSRRCGHQTVGFLSVALE